jgi:hypothetical protein
MADYNINAVTRRVVYSGSAGTGPYAFSFEVLVSSDIVVYFNSTSLTLTTDYTVVINANGTGSVTIVTGTNVPTTPDASDTIIIVGARDIERTTDFVTAGDLLAASLNEQLDGLTIFDQQIAEEQKRSLMAPVYDPAHVDDGGTLDMTLPAKADRLGKSLVFNATTGNPEAGPTSTDIANAQTNATAAAASAVAAAASETAAGVSETNAAASAASAASVLEDIIFNDVVYLTSASSPYTLATTQSGVLLAIDTSGGAVTVNLPSIASAGDGWRISAKKTTGDANFVTFARNGTDTIDGNTSDTITTVGQSKTYVADTDGTPDDWTSVNFGSTLGRTWTDFTYTASGGETSVTGADDDGVVLAYQAGQVKVYLEGLLLDDSDYTATTGTSITGLAALVAGQTLYIETWDNVMSLGTMAAQDANAVAITGGTLASITSINAVTPATAQYTTALDTKLGGIEALADVTDATNVTAAGALMDSELTSIASVKALNQGVATTDTPTFAGIITSGNVDGRDVSVDGTKLDGIEAAADVTDATNVTAAGALMDSELTDIAAVKALDQGVATTDSPTFVNVTATDLDGILGSNTPAAATVTTLTASGNLTFTGSNPKISGGDTDGYLALAGNTLFSGAAVQLYGSTHATTPFDIVFLNSGTPHSRYDYSATAWDFGTNALTTTGTLSAGATDVTTLTASGDAVVDNLGTGGISPVRDLHVSNAGTNVFAQWTNNTTGHTTTDGWLSGMPNGTDFRYYGYEVGGVFTFYPEETLSLTVAKLGVTVAGTLSAGATTVTTLTASDDVNLANTKSITFKNAASTVRDIVTLFSDNHLYIDNQDGDIILRNGTPSLTLAASGAATFAGTLSAGATTVSTGASGATANASADDLVVNASGNGGLSVLTPDANTGNLYIGSPTQPVGYGVSWNYNAGTAYVYTTKVGASMIMQADNGVTNLTLSGAAGSELATFAGDVTVNGDVTASNGFIKGVNGGSAFYTTAGDEYSTSLGHQAIELSTGGWKNAASFIANTGVTGATRSTTGLILGSSYGANSYASAALNVNCNSGSGSFEFLTGTGTGVPTAKFTVSNAGNATFAGTADITNGVYIGGSAAANLLDDYEEGTWTPAISGDGTAGTYTNGTTQATYTKIGRMVTVNFGIGSFSTATGGTGNLRITGLPFTKTAGQSPTGSVWFSSVNTGASVISLALVFSTAAGASATLNVNEVVDNAVVQLTPISGVGVSSQIHGSITYFV